MKNPDYNILENTMNALMLKHWGIVLIKEGEPLFTEKVHTFNSENSIFDTVHSKEATVIAIAVPYRLTSDYKCPGVSYGKVEAFAWDYDYHVEIKGILVKVLNQLENQFDQKFEQVDFCVDNSPYNDREVAFYAGLGSVGKNHLLIHPVLGTRFFIGYIVIKNHLLYSELPINQSIQSDRFEGCESCGRCVSACPTKVCGYEVTQMNLCLSEMTQTKELIEEVNRINFKRQLYGCSICQEVCPANSNTSISTCNSFLLTSHTSNWIELFDLLKMTSRAFKTKFGKMGFAWRPLWVYKRNALIILSGSKSMMVLERLKEEKYLEKDERLGEYYKWAINRLCISTTDG
jgi:Uncharacterized Fe-S protein